jgi:hypothetical protein
MGYRYQVIVACCVALLLGACAQTTALEPQNRALDARQARLYFIRHPAILRQIGSADIKVDGKLVGSVATGAYLVVDRSPGPHKITVYGLIDPTGFETDIHVEPGKSYYFELGPIVRINIDTFTYASMGVSGKPLPGRFGANSPFMFYSLDATAGAASVARIGNS